jgi:ribosomal protein S18 acetylase RimI-like enzyme
LGESEAGCVRPMRAAEAESVLELWIDLVDHHRRLDPSHPGSGGLLPALRRELARALREPDCQVLVAEVERRVCGFLLAEIEHEGKEEAPPGGWIHELYVDPAWRGRGLGSQLVARAEAFFAERTGSRVCVRVEARNAEGLRFWERRGFAERARILERVL